MTTTEPEFLSSTRASYDAVAADYAERFRGELVAKPVERALLAAFVELVRETGAGTGQVADIGCGTGRVTGYLHSLGLPAFGIDLSPGMLATARKDHPELRFEEGSMLALDLPDGELGGVLAWYSTIHVPQDRLPEAFAEFHRVLAPGGHLLLGFQSGDEPRYVTEAFGHPVSLNFHRRWPDQIAALLEQAGLAITARVLRERETEGGRFPELTPQGFVLARKPVAGG